MADKTDNVNVNTEETKDTTKVHTVQEMRDAYDELATKEETLRRNLAKVAEQREVLFHAIAAQEAADNVLNTTLNVQSGKQGQASTEPKK